MTNASSYWTVRGAFLALIGVGLVVYGAVAEITWKPPPPPRDPTRFELQPAHSGGSALMIIGGISVLVGGAMVWNERRKRKPPAWTQG